MMQAEETRRSVCHETTPTEPLSDEAGSGYQDTYRQLYGTSPPQGITFGASQADILSEGRGFMGGFDLTMQTQVGCPAGCLFCYVPNGRFLTPSAVRGPQGRHWGFVVRDKTDVARKLRKHLSQGALADKTIYWSGITDPYAAQPGETRAVWQVLCETPFPLRPRRIAVQTRFRADRDAALIAHYGRETAPSDQGPAVVVSYSIGTDRNDLIRAWERATPSFEQRMRTIESLRRAGIFVVATLSPFGLWTNLPATLHQLKAWGVAYITVLFFKEGTSSANTPQHFLTYLRAQYPVLLDPAWQAERIQEIQAVYPRVLIGREGFESLTRPHEIAAG
jgi:DNA repair photolyase